MPPRQKSRSATSTGSTHSVPSADWSRKIQPVLIAVLSCLLVVSLFFHSKDSAQLAPFSLVPTEELDTAELAASPTTPPDPQGRPSPAPPQREPARYFPVEDPWLQLQNIKCGPTPTVTTPAASPAIPVAQTLAARATSVFKPPEPTKFTRDWEKAETSEWFNELVPEKLRKQWKIGGVSGGYGSGGALTRTILRRTRPLIGNTDRLRLVPSLSVCLSVCVSLCLCSRRTRASYFIELLCVLLARHSRN